MIPQEVYTRGKPEHPLLSIGKTIIYLFGIGILALYDPHQ